MTKVSTIEKHFDKVASSYDSGKEKYSFYYSSLKKLLISLIGKNKIVFEFGCGTGDLLASLDPKIGYGTDISPEMVKLAKIRHGSNKNLYFSVNQPPVTSHQSLDYIFMSDVIEHLENPQLTFKQICRLMDSKTKLVITMANPIWEPLLMIWEKLGWKMKEGPHKRITNYELQIMIEKAGMKVTKHDHKLLVPIQIPLITNFANKCLEKYLKRFAFIEYFVTIKR